MTRTLCIVVLAVLFVSVLSVAFGTVTSTHFSRTPYFTALSSFAVTPAEACPTCNAKICSQGVCVPEGPTDDPHQCCIVLGHCQSPLCNP